jgi:hypothetical protein
MTETVDGEDVAAFAPARGAALILFSTPWLTVGGVNAVGVVTAKMVWDGVKW